MMMKALFWKDLRIFADVFLAALAMLLGSYFLAFILFCGDTRSGFAWSKVIAGGASLTRFSSILICALLGAYALGREREDRSLLFLAALPAPRRHIIASKLLLSVASFLVIWLVSMVVMFGGLIAIGESRSIILPVMELMLGYMASGVMAFGAAWLLSTFMKDAIGSAFTGLMSLIPVFTAQFIVNEFLDNDTPMFFHPVTTIFMFAAGTVGIGAGSLRFLRNGAGDRITRRRVRRQVRQSAVMQSWRNQNQSVALLWKDIRLMRTSLLAGCGMLALPYVASLAGQAQCSYVRIASVVSIALSCLVYSFWSSQVMSGERASRTEDFLATLPVSRLKVARGRIMVVVAPVILASAINLFILVLTNNAMVGETRFDLTFSWRDWPDAPFIIMGFGLVNGAALGFAVALFLSAYYRKAATAAVVGAMVAFVGLALWAAISTTLAMSDTPTLTAIQFVLLFSIGAFTLAVMTVAAGGAIAIRSASEHR